MTEIDFDGLAVKLAGIAGAAVSMRYLQGSPKAKLTMAAGGALMAYYASPYLSQRVGLPEGLTGFLLGMFGMAVVSRAWVSMEQAPSQRCGKPSSTASAAAREVPEMDGTLFITAKAVLAFVCWLVVAGGAGLAVFAPQINDTLLERIGLSAICITAFGTAWRVVTARWATDGGLR